jgi:hypothetical protein
MLSSVKTSCACMDCVPSTPRSHIVPRNVGAAAVFRRTAKPVRTVENHLRELIRMQHFAKHDVRNRLPFVSRHLIHSVQRSRPRSQYQRTVISLVAAILHFPGKTPAVARADRYGESAQKVAIRSDGMANSCGRDGRSSVPMPEAFLPDCSSSAPNGRMSHSPVGACRGCGDE